MRLVPAVLLCGEICSQQCTNPCPRRLLQLAARQVPWEPQLHSRFPHAFSEAVRALLLVHRRGDGTAAAGGSSGGSARSKGRRRREPARQEEPGGRNLLALLPPEVLLLVIKHAAFPLSAWL